MVTAKAPAAVRAELLASQHISSLGEIVRRARRGRFTLEELARHAGVSVGLISQIERGRGNPSLVTLIKLTHALGIPIEDLFEGPPGQRRMLVTKDERARLELPTEGREGFVFELLAPDLDRKIAMTRAKVPSGWDNEQAPYSRPGEHCLHLLDGSLHVSVGGELFHLRAGDTLTFDSSLPHWYRNDSSRPAQIITAMTPPHGLTAAQQTDRARAAEPQPIARARALARSRASAGRSRPAATRKSATTPPR